MFKNTTFRALRHRNFRLFFFGQFISLIGTWMQAVAQGWLVLQLSNSALVLGLVGACGHLPALLFSFWGGSFADRVNKKHIVLTAQTAALVLAFSLGVLITSGLVKIWHVAFVAFFTGTVLAFDLPARQSFLIEMVGRDDLANAIGLNSSIFNAARLIGPAIGGLVIAKIGVGACYFLNSLSFVAVITGLLRMGPLRVKDKAPSDARESVGAFAGYLQENTKICYALAMVAAFSLLVLPYTVLLPMVARDILKVGPKGLGFLFGANGLGALIGALVTASVPGQTRRMWHLFSMSLLFAFFILLFSLCQKYYCALICLFFAGMSMVGFFTTANAFVQLNVPDEKRGRIMGLYGIAFLGMMPLGSLFSGGLAHYVGVPKAISTGAVLAASVSVWLWASGSRRLRWSLGSEW